MQRRCYNADIKPYATRKDKVLSVVYRIFNTQSRPRMNLLGSSSRFLYSNKKCFGSFGNFVRHINDNRDVVVNYSSLFNGMNAQDGWGPKTAALFVKSIYHLHNGKYGGEELKIWNDAPGEIEDGDIFKLPVDAVMGSIFEKINPTGEKLSFAAANRRLNDMGYSATEIEIWDDLWFWGFFTQFGGGDDRQFGWNENKYWSQRDTSKDEKSISDIKSKAKVFLKILED